MLILTLLKDFINPIDLCNKLNQFILPDVFLHGFLTLIMLINGFWFSLLLNLPLFAYNIKKLIDKNYLLDATEIFRTLGKHKRESFLKIAFHLGLFFFYLWMMIMSLIESEEE